MELDDFDLQILQSLQEDNQRTSQEVAERVNLSPVSCLRRMKRLRESGAVLGDVSVVDPAAVGRDIMMVVLVSLESERADKLDTFKRAMRNAPEIMQCLAVTGEVDFVVTMTVRDMAEYDAFAQRHFWGDPNVKRFSTLVVMNRVKYGLAVPTTHPGQA
ncbi:Lrp/AsnC family transcriptional regulator [Achromobacter sp. SIMBA_011]|uniref:DNA-binding transcriptional activator DecR n=3 Tax=Achromobacter TaxID=222 RepID=A0A6S7CZC0_9BURK|nr:MULTISPECIES: Lrp/AsnC family transcriptional regulator [Achromobacter]ALX86384.1 ArsR family transcriptional regulator [Achromobacter denitrificans]AKP92373.1 Transcriptional regulator, AsnC family [Achromobacter xylosoxidans]AOU95633.1 AsnC family transcriptional regulator [Achromobacter ruhlandii]MBK1982597.1 Lrp/AsnC family transcriptional regulator [Achromobacter xylosoxidans]MCV6799149.1 Lrp/AsnC family transcriptional regulator [Achromobacter ruhlandii]